MIGEDASAMVRRTAGGNAPTQDARRGFSEIGATRALVDASLRIDARMRGACRAKPSDPHARRRVPSVTGRRGVAIDQRHFSGVSHRARTEHRDADLPRGASAIHTAHRQRTPRMVDSRRASTMHIARRRRPTAPDRGRSRPTAGSAAGAAA